MTDTTDTIELPDDYETLEEIACGFVVEHWDGFPDDEWKYVEEEPTGEGDEWYQPTRTVYRRLGDGTYWALDWNRCHLVETEPHEFPSRKLVRVYRQVRVGAEWTTRKPSRKTTGAPDELIRVLAEYVGEDAASQLAEAVVGMGK